MFTLVSPAAVGPSAERLNRIAPHLNRYVDEGKLPGYQVLVARRGQPADCHFYDAINAVVELSGSAGVAGVDLSGNC